MVCTTHFSAAMGSRPDNGVPHAYQHRDLESSFCAPAATNNQADKTIDVYHTIFQPSGVHYFRAGG